MRIPFFFSMPCVCLSLLLAGVVHPFRLELCACPGASIWHGAMASCKFLDEKYPENGLFGGETYTLELPSYTLSYT